MKKVCSDVEVLKTVSGAVVAVALFNGNGHNGDIAMLYYCSNGKTPRIIDFNEATLHVVQSKNSRIVFDKHNAKMQWVAITNIYYDKTLKKIENSRSVMPPNSKARMVGLFYDEYVNFYGAMK